MALLDLPRELSDRRALPDVKNLVADLGATAVDRPLRGPAHTDGVAAGEIDDVARRELPRQPRGEREAESLGGAGHESDPAHVNHGGEAQGTDRCPSGQAAVRASSSSSV